MVKRFVPSIERCEKTVRRNGRPAQCRNKALKNNDYCARHQRIPYEAPARELRPRQPRDFEDQPLESVDIPVRVGDMVRLPPVRSRSALMAGAPPRDRSIGIVTGLHPVAGRTDLLVWWRGAEEARIVRADEVEGVPILLVQQAARCVIIDD